MPMRLWQEHHTYDAYRMRRTHSIAVGAFAIAVAALIAFMLLRTDGGFSPVPPGSRGAIDADGLTAPAARGAVQPEPVADRTTGEGSKFLFLFEGVPQLLDRVMIWRANGASEILHADGDHGYARDGEGHIVAIDDRYAPVVCWTEPGPVHSITLDLLARVEIGGDPSLSTSTQLVCSEPVEHARSTRRLIDLVRKGTARGPERDGRGPSYGVPREVGKNLAQAVVLTSREQSQNHEQDRILGVAGQTYRLRVNTRGPVVESGGKLMFEAKGDSLESSVFRLEVPGAHFDLSRPGGAFVTGEVVLPPAFATQSVSYRVLGYRTVGEFRGVSTEREGVAAPGRFRIGPVQPGTKQLQFRSRSGDREFFVNQIFEMSESGIDVGRVEARSEVVVVVDADTSIGGAELTSKVQVLGSSGGEMLRHEGAINLVFECRVGKETHLFGLTPGWQYRFSPGEVRRDNLIMVSSEGVEVAVPGPRVRLRQQVLPLHSLTLRAAVSSMDTISLQCAPGTVVKPAELGEKREGGMWSQQWRCVPGRYFAFFRSGGANAARIIDVGDSDVDIAMQMVPGVTLRCRLPEPWEGRNVMIASEYGNLGGDAVGSDGRLEVQGVPANHRVRLTSYLKAMPELCVEVNTPDPGNVIEIGPESWSRVQPK